MAVAREGIRPMRDRIALHRARTTVVAIVDRRGTGPGRRRRATTTGVLRGACHSARGQRAADPLRDADVPARPAQRDQPGDQRQAGALQDHQPRRPPIAVSGVVIVPKTPVGRARQPPGHRLRAGTQGMGDRCAPSRQYAEGLEYEGVGDPGTAEPRLRRRDDRLRGSRHRRRPHLHGPRRRRAAPCSTSSAPPSSCPAPACGTSPVGHPGLLARRRRGRLGGRARGDVRPGAQGEGRRVGAVPADLHKVADQPRRRALLRVRVLRAARPGRRATASTSRPTSTPRAWRP